MQNKFHLLHTHIQPPALFTYPFCYKPHALSLLAAEELQTYVAQRSDWQQELSQGKMFGVLVATNQQGQLGFLAAFSGLLCGSNNHSYFVDPIFDTTPPDGYFKVNECKISALNRQIATLTHSSSYQQARQEVQQATLQAQQEEECYKQKMAQAKAERNKRRAQPEGLSAEEEQLLIRESQFMKAELHRIKQRNKQHIAALQQQVDTVSRTIQQLKAQRKRMSDQLQQWLFEQYTLLNAQGEQRSIIRIFQDLRGTLPPAGTGDCCAPKLLQYAFRQRLHPVCMAEFWWGASPKTEIRHHLHFYPACRGKCLPILTFMLQGLKVEHDPLSQCVSQPLEVIFEDDSLIVVCKPAGMLSVPGRSARESVLSLLQQRCPGMTGPVIVHRLDMATSGLIVAAKSKEVHKALQAQFKERSIKKRYIALLDGTLALPKHGTVSLPIRPDPLDRPRQVVDMEAGKTAITEYTVISTDGHTTRIALWPHTGRTHQLRVHCASPLGLNAPIQGDALYGRPAGRLFLHAESISFTHPITQQRMTFERKADF